jgi:hypothetical protein
MASNITKAAGRLRERVKLDSMPLMEFRRFSCIFIGLTMATTACQKDSIQTYQVPKEPQAAAAPMGMGMAGAMAPAADAKEITWKVPKGWQEQTPSSMRVGSFLIKGPDGQQADMSVVPLSGEAGGDLQNINRWRGQINLHPISEADLSAQSESIFPAGRRMRYIDFVSHDRMIQQRYKKRLMAAIYHQEGRSWFFKIIGDDTTVLSAKPALMQFLRSLNFPKKPDHE